MGRFIHDFIKHDALHLNTKTVKKEKAGLIIPADLQGVALPKNIKKNRLSKSIDLVALGVKRRTKISDDVINQDSFLI